MTEPQAALSEQGRGQVEGAGPGQHGACQCVPQGTRPLKIWEEIGFGETFVHYIVPKILP